MVERICNSVFPKCRENPLEFLIRVDISTQEILLFFFCLVESFVFLLQEIQFVLNVQIS